MIKKLNKIKVLLVTFCLLSPFSTAYAALLDVSSLSVDHVSANLSIAGVIDESASASIVPPVLMVMGTYQNPIVPISNTFTGGSFSGSIYSSGDFGAPTPSAVVNTTAGVFDSVDLSSLRLQGTLTLDTPISGMYTFDTELWPLTTDPTSSMYDALTGDFSMTWAFSGDMLAINGLSLASTLDVTISGTATVVPVPAAVWLFASGMLGLLGVARRKS